MKLTIGKKKISLNPDTMMKAGSFEAYYEKFPGFAAKLGVDEEFLKRKLREAYILTIKPEPKSKVQKQPVGKSAVQATAGASGGTGSKK